MKRKIFEKQIIDYTTGEITSTTLITSAKMSETFWMGRKTEGVEWLYELTGNQIKTLIFLLDLEELPKGDNNTDKVIMYVCTLGKLKRDELLGILGCTSSYLSRLLKSLETSGWIIRLNKTDFLLNPKGFYKGSSKEVLPRIIEFEKLHKSLYTKEQSSTTRSKDRRRKSSEMGNFQLRLEEDIVWSLPKGKA